MIKMNNEIEILQKIFGEKKYKIINEQLDINNYVCTFLFCNIRILKFKDNLHSNKFIYVVYVCNLEIPYKLDDFNENFFINIKNIYCNNLTNYTNRLKRFSGINTKLNITKDNLEKKLIKNKYLELYYWGSYFEQYPFDINKRKYSNYEINKMNIYALRQYNDNNDVFEINVLTKYSKSKIKFVIFENILFIELNYNSINNNELEKFYKSTQNIPYNLPIDLYMALSEFDLLDYNDIFNLKPITMNHFKYSSLLLSNTIEIENYFKLLNNLNLESKELIKYRDEMINLIILNNIIYNINSQEIINIINESNNNKEDSKEKILDYLLNYFNDYKSKNNTLTKELIKLEEHNNDFLNLHIDNLINKFLNK